MYAYTLSLSPSLSLSLSLIATHGRMHAHAKQARASNDVPCLTSADLKVTIYTSTSKV